MTKLRLGNFLELIPRDPPPLMAGLILVGVVEHVEDPEFVLRPWASRPGELVVFRVDENEELAIKLNDGSTFELGRSIPAERWNSF